DEQLRALPVEIRERATLYAKGELPGSQFLVETDVEPTPSDPLLDYGAPEDADEESLATEQPVAPGDDESKRPGGTSSTPIRRAHALQLVRYLEKTRDTRGPGNDLIHLEAAGAIWDLDPEVAERLERDALNNRGADVIRTIESLPERGERGRATLMLSQ